MSSPQSMKFPDDLGNSIIITIPSQVEGVSDEGGPQPSCPICYTTLPLKDQFFATINCKHIFCKDCFNEYIESKVQNFQVINIQCPQEGCPEVCSDKNLKDALDEAKYSKYQELVLKKLKNRKSSANICPQPGCARSVKTSKKNKSDILCACGTHICKQCFTLSHPGKTCLQNLHPEFESYAHENEIRFCMMCKTPVTREEGCNHMTCCVCDYEWCWTCGKRDDFGHKCSGFWNPSESNRYNLKQCKKIVGTKLAFLCRILLKTLVLPFLGLYYLIFWPYVLYQKSQAEAREAQESVRRIASSDNCLEPTLLVIMGIFLFPLTLIIGILCGICYLPGAIKKLKGNISSYYQQKQLTKRWMTGKIDKFKYTETARPTLDAERTRNIG